MTSRGGVGKKSFISQLLNIPNREFYSPSKSNNKLINWILGCIKVLHYSKRNDTIICWYDFQAILCWWICRLFLLKRNIICINILLKDKSTIKNRIVSFLYRKALTSSNLKASITSLKYGKWLNRKLKIKVEYTLIHDVYYDNYAYPEAINPTPNSVFCGGYNGRDWNFMIKIAQAMPDVTFTCVMPKAIFLRLASLMPQNINALYNIPYNEFIKELCRSSLVCLPLDTQAPAGLIVMFQAAANKKMVITTDTVTTSEYITPDRGEILKNEIEIWRNAITHSLADIDGTQQKAITFKKYLKEHCSETEFVQNLRKMLK